VFLFLVKYIASGTLNIRIWIQLWIRT
jgi:hypothetical protein